MSSRPKEPIPDFDRQGRWVLLNPRARRGFILTQAASDCVIDRLELLRFVALE